VVFYFYVLAMRPTLDEALTAVFGKEAPKIAEEESVQDLVRQLVELYSRANPL